MSKKLRITWQNCTVCDSNKIEVTTELGNDEWLYDGDKAKCLNCFATGAIETDGDIAWFELDEGSKNVQLH